MAAPHPCCVLAVLAAVMWLSRPASSTMIVPSLNITFAATSRLGSQFNFTAPIFPVIDCSFPEEEAAKATGKIVMSWYCTIGWYNHFFSMFKKYNVSGFVYDDDWSNSGETSNGALLRSRGIDVDVHFPFVTSFSSNNQLVISKLLEMRQQQQGKQPEVELLVTIISDQPSMTEVAGNSVWLRVAQVLLITMSCGILILISVRLPGWLAYTRKNGFNTAIAVLLVSLLSTVLRLVFYSVDIFSSSGNMPFFWGQFLLTITFPFNVSCSFLIALFWGEILSPQVYQVRSFLKESRPLFITVVVIIILLEITNSFLRGTNVNFAIVVFISLPLISFVTIVIAVYYLRVSFELIKYISAKKGTEVTQATSVNTSAYLRLLISKIAINVIGIALTLISSVVFLLHIGYSTFIFYCLLHFGLQVWTIGQVTLHSKAPAK